MREKVLQVQRLPSLQYPPCSIFFIILFFVSLTGNSYTRAESQGRY